LAPVLRGVPALRASSRPGLAVAPGRCPVQQQENRTPGGDRRRRASACYDMRVRPAARTHEHCFGGTLTPERTWPSSAASTCSHRRATRHTDATLSPADWPPCTFTAPVARTSRLMISGPALGDLETVSGALGDPATLTLTAGPSTTCSPRMRRQRLPPHQPDPPSAASRGPGAAYLPHRRRAPFPRRTDAHRPQPIPSRCCRARGPYLLGRRSFVVSIVR